MDDIEPTAPADASPPDPPKDPPATTMPNNVAVILHAVGILLTYGRHLIDTVRQRATVAPSFNAIAANFGTARLSTILAHLNRGILRAAALERLLLARAATGRDFDIVERRAPPPPPPQPTPADTQTEPPPTERKPAPRPSRPAGWNDPELYMPTEQDLDRQVRRRPLGRTVYDICLDLAVAPGYCHPAFWNELFDIMNAFGGSIAALMREKARRREAFDKEQDRVIDSNWDWVRMSRDAIRQAVGFFIGEPPINPLDPAAAIATAPP
jgi:hypothetical protein